MKIRLGAGDAVTVSRKENVNILGDRSMVPRMLGTTLAKIGEVLIRWRFNPLVIEPLTKERVRLGIKLVQPLDRKTRLMTFHQRC